MSLNTDWTRVGGTERWGTNKKWDDCTPAEQREWTKAQYFGFLLMGIDMGGVTEENLLEVQVRAKIFQSSVGGVIGFDGEDYHYTNADIASYVGYSTNISIKTRAQWLKRLALIVEQDIKRVTRFSAEAVA
jgi:hypothetical protein